MDALTSAPAAPATSPQGTSPSPTASPAEQRPSKFRTDATVIAPLPSERKAAADAAAAESGGQPAAGRDPATGKFVKGSGDPNAGVIPELRRDTPPADEPDGEPVALRVEGAPTNAAGEFLFEYVSKDGKRSVFKTQKALEAHIHRVTANASAEAQQNATLKEQVAELQRRLSPPKDEPKTPENSDPTNPFDVDVLDTKFDSMWERVAADFAEGKPEVALARYADFQQKQMKDFITFLNHTRTQEMTPMQNFIGALNSINQTSEFFKERSIEVDDSTGDLKYPLIRSRKDVVNLTAFMKKHTLPLTQEGFGLAYEVVLARNTAPGEQKTAGAPSLESRQAAAAGAAPLSSGGRAPDPRAEPRKQTWREEYNATADKSGKFRV